MKTAEEVFRALADVKEGLRAVLTAMDGGMGETPSYQQALERVRAASQELGDPGSLTASVPVEHHDRLMRDMEEWLRLVSLVATVAEREMGEVQGHLAGVRAVRRTLRLLSDDPPAGGACDLSA